ncbi:MAG TPA: 4Fe-4S ferredoxin [Spirochaetaceae bacterium]|nr:4Fe-4S ferredoxin [Spirochaetaceae bacterium]
MAKSKVYWTDFRTVAFGDGPAEKLKKLIMKAGIANIDMQGKFVAVKMHFGEKGNMSFLRPNYAKAICDVVSQLGGKPFLTDCNTMYPGSRKNALEHLYCAWENGFSPLSAGAPVIIADGLKGTDDVEVAVEGGEYVKNAKIGRAVMDADVFISLAHFKGHEMTGFGGAIKNVGMGCGSRAGKTDQHSNGQPVIDESLCRGCKACMRECANKGLEFDSSKKKMHVNSENCVGCGRCLGACNFDAISFANDAALEMLNRKMVEYTKAVVQNRPAFYINIAQDISPNCDCHGENDAPLVPNIGMFASFDPLAIDVACRDKCQEAPRNLNTQLHDRKKEKGFRETGDLFLDNNPESEYMSLIDHAVKIGLGSKDYELVFCK